MIIDEKVCYHGQISFCKIDWLADSAVDKKNSVVCVLSAKWTLSEKINSLKVLTFSLRVILSENRVVIVWICSQSESVGLSVL